MTEPEARDWHVVGAVLAGGASRRMGRPKATIHLEGVTLLERAATALRLSGAEQVLVIGGDPAWAEDAGLVHLADRWPGQGPLGAIATAVADGPDLARTIGAGGEAPVERNASTVVVVVACDQPRLTAAALRLLVQALGHPPPVEPDAHASATTEPAGVLVAAGCGADGRLQPFPSAWPAALGDGLIGAFEAGERRADAGFALAEVVPVHLDDDVLRDVDTPADLERLTTNDPDHRSYP